MKVQIGGLEIHVDSMDELDQLVARYGNSTEPKKPPAKTNGGQNVAGAEATAHLILEKLVEAGVDGISTTTLGNWLGRRGKAVGPALDEWAVKIGLVNDGTIRAVERARPGGGRGWRLKSDFIDVGKRLLEHGK